MTLSQILATGTTGLLAHQAALGTTAQNVANAGNEDYARRSASFESAAFGGIGNVHVERIADRYLDAAAAAARSDAGRAAILAETLGRVVDLFGAPGSDTGLASSLTKIGNAAVALSATASDTARAAFLGAVDTFFRDAAGVKNGIAQIGGEAGSRLEGAVAEANALLERIARLNREVATASLRGLDAGTAADHRGAAVRALGEMLAVSVRQEPDGSLTVETRGGVELAGREAASLRLNGRDVFVEVAGREPAVLTPAAAGGKIGALGELLTARLPSAVQEVDRLLAEVSAGLNAAHNMLGSAVPPPAITGRDTGLLGGDLLAMNGTLEISLMSSNGIAAGSFSISAGELPTDAAIDDLAALIGDKSAGRVGATFSEGRLSLTSRDDGLGIRLSGDAARYGQPLASAFGLNDLTGSAAAAGVSAADLLGAAPGESFALELRSSAGALLGRFSWTAGGGERVSDLLSALNESEIGAHCGFSLGAGGELRFGGGEGLVLTAPSDSTTRGDTGRSVLQLLGLPVAAPEEAAIVRPAALGLFDFASGVAAPERFAGALTGGEELLSALVGYLGLAAKTAAVEAEDSASTSALAEQRRLEISGVRLDEEMTRMIALQNGYSASARVVTTARDMYDILLSVAG